MSLVLPYRLAKTRARQIWLAAQRLDTRVPFGDGPAATRAAIEHLGYVQIDTIHVIERCHHHILYTRIPAYERAHLRRAQRVDKSVFEYWTHALSYVPTKDIRFFLPAMKRYREAPDNWFSSVTPADLRKVLTNIRKNGPVTIRDVEDKVLVDKAHPWASRKPSKRALELAFFMGYLAISERAGMLKSYELIDRHFGWEKRPRLATEGQVDSYILDRSIRSQGIISVESACHLDAKRKPRIRKQIEAMVRRKELVPVAIDGAGRQEHWVGAEALDTPTKNGEELVHILSPFDPLIIQRKRVEFFFDYKHRFEAYLPKEKRVFGYFVLPVLVGDEIVAAIDLKTDRVKRKLLIQQWSWVGAGSAPRYKKKIEEELDRFERFQFAT